MNSPKKFRPPKKLKPIFFSLIISLCVDCYFDLILMTFVFSPISKPKGKKRKRKKTCPCDGVRQRKQQNKDKQKKMSLNKSSDKSIIIIYSVLDLLFLLFHHFWVSFS